MDTPYYNILKDLKTAQVEKFYVDKINCLYDSVCINFALVTNIGTLL